MDFLAQLAPETEWEKCASIWKKTDILLLHNFFFFFLTSEIKS